MSYWSVDGRHEDDLLYAASVHGGTVPLRDLLHHCEMVIADNPAAFGANVCDPVKALCDYVRTLACGDFDVEVPIKVRQ